LANELISRFEELTLLPLTTPHPSRRLERMLCCSTSCVINKVTSKSRNLSTTHALIKFPSLPIIFGEIPWRVFVDAEPLGLGGGERETNNNELRNTETAQLFKRHLICYSFAFPNSSVEFPSLVSGIRSWELNSHKIISTAPGGIFLLWLWSTRDSTSSLMIRTRLTKCSVRDDFPGVARALLFSPLLGAV
jgi:hypothetical protein